MRDIKYTKEKSNGLRYNSFDLPRMVNEGSIPSLGTKGSFNNIFQVIRKVRVEFL